MTDNSAGSTRRGRWRRWRWRRRLDETGRPVRDLVVSLRFRLAATSFATAYAPIFVLLVSSAVFSYSVDSYVIANSDQTTSEAVQVEAGLPLIAVLIVMGGFAPFAAWFAWWWSGRVIRPLNEAITIQERLLEETSHELRTPLAVLSTNSEVLLAHPDPTLEVYRQGLERTGAMTQRMTDTIDTLLVDARGRARSLNKIPVDLGSVINRLVDSLTPLADGGGVTILVDAAGNLPARVDELSVERAISNVVTNAIEHSPAGGSVTVSAQRADSYIAVTVTDEGPGISPDNHNKVFERYWQSDSSTGSGIGLAIVRQVTEAHGGTVVLRSPLSELGGASFLLTFKA